MSASLEGLHPDLMASVIRHPIFGTMIDHPLIKDRYMELPFSDEISRVDQANKFYAIKKEALAVAVSALDWNSFIFVHERSYRFDALCEIREMVGWDYSDIWPIVRDVWIDSENIFQNLEGWREIWEVNCRRKKSTMRSADRTALQKLPKKFAVYRGAREEAHIAGMSWTTDRAKAEWFSRRLDGGTSVVAEGIVRKSDVVAYFNERKENEIVILPNNVSSMKIHKIILKKAA